MNDEIINKKSSIETLITEPLDQLSINELKDRVKFLELEINRCNEKIVSKELSKSAADSVFN
ncbi:MAG: DUF1192 domain-containing protein [Alphaproteobacteria bacterium]|jgi:uncharacterized small protein (DUF1192 family)|nr:MAG: hypothetical protein CNC74_03575 [alpha proteobacterium MED-G09]|tara:strand:+ start:504 stop:689 length:186 start_codon:yes stop_codon:yes gene_type:complete